MNEKIEVRGARVHNLKNIDIDIPRNQLVVITGMSGSGKSSLAFDTIYAEGQRRYVETFSAYARQFLGNLERPDVDTIKGLSPVISIEQKTIGRNPRSTVGTVTEVYDFIRLLYARAGVAYSYNTGEKMVRYTDEQLVDLLLDQYNGKKIILLAPQVKGRKGHYRELFERLGKLGYAKVRVDGEILDITPGMKLSRYQIHDIELVVDRLKIDKKDRHRISQSIQLGLKLGDGRILIQNFENDEVKNYSKNLVCPTTGVAYKEPEPNLFSFNSPYGACPVCNGLGKVAEADIDKIIPDNSLSIAKGAIVPFKEVSNKWMEYSVAQFLQAEGYSLNTPIKDLPEETFSKLMNGGDYLMEDETAKKEFKYFRGINAQLRRHFEEADKVKDKRWASAFLNQLDCDSCGGSRINTEARHYKFHGKTIPDLIDLSLADLQEFFVDAKENLNETDKKIATGILKEIIDRLRFINQVGLTYLSLNRAARTLSGGESQRIRLASQIGSELVNVLYILDEPSIGLHQRDNTRLIQSLKNLRDNGNSILVVEHDREIMEDADYVIDIGPGAGKNGGNIITKGHFKDLLAEDSVTAKYLKNEIKIPTPLERRKGNGKHLELKGASGHNLKNVNLKIPLGTFTVVSGVSGSGKSSLINQTLYPILNAEIYNGVKVPLPYKSISGIENIDKIINIDQSPIGRTPRSNSATYTGMFTEIRNLYANINESKIRGYKPGRFSFNVKGGRCEECKGAGVRVVEMNFLPDVQVECETCLGKRYNRATLEVKFKGKSINDVLEMSILEASDFFESIPKINRKLKTLVDVGLGYIKLGQPATTLSGGEAQRIKLATELSKRSTGKTLYLLDEPSTGLHFEDIRMLLEVLNKLVSQGNTVLVIEHNLDIVKVADYLVDIGPEGGDGGGKIVAKGTPEQVAKKKESITGHYLINELKR